MWKIFYSLFHNSTKKENLRLLVRKLQIGNEDIMKNNSCKFLDVILDERLKSKDHIKIIGNKFQKSLHLFYPIRDFITKKPWLTFITLMFHG